MNHLGAFFNFIGYIVLKYIFRQNVKVDNWFITHPKCFTVGIITTFLLIVFASWLGN